MDDRRSPDWRDVLDGCGLEVLGEPVQDGPPVRAALYAVNGVEVEPVVEIPGSAPGAAEELDRAWHRQAGLVGLTDEDGAFRILVPGPGGSAVGWVRVRDRVGSGLPSRVAAVTGSPEFIAVSTDGRRLCAASVEDAEYWIVVHGF